MTARESDGYKAGLSGESPITRPPLNRQDDKAWLKGWTRGIKIYRENIPRIGTAWISSGMERGAEARQIRGTTNKHT